MYKCGLELNLLQCSKYPVYLNYKNIYPVYLNYNNLALTCSKVELILVWLPQLGCHQI